MQWWSTVVLLVCLPEVWRPPPSYCGCTKCGASRRIDSPVPRLVPHFDRVLFNPHASTGDGLPGVSSDNILYFLPGTMGVLYLVLDILILILIRYNLCRKTSLVPRIHIVSLSTVHRWLHSAFSLCRQCWFLELTLCILKVWTFFGEALRAINRFSFIWRNQINWVINALKVFNQLNCPNPATTVFPD